MTVSISLTILGYVMERGLLGPGKFGTSGYKMRFLRNVCLVLVTIETTKELLGNIESTAVSDIMTSITSSQQRQTRTQTSTQAQ